MIKISDLEKTYRLKIVKSEIAKNKDEAKKLAKDIGYPVALKIDSSYILHKSDIGGVYLNLANNIEVENAYDNIMESVKSNLSSVKINGVTLQEMIPSGFELIIGYTNDMVFGPTIMLGMGGIFTEAFKDITFRALPITKEDALSMIDDLKFSKQLLGGFRNIRKVSADTISDVILKSAKLAWNFKDTIESFDINPAIFYDNDYRIVDFKCIQLQEKRNPLNDKPNTTDMNSFFNAGSIAIVGATINPDRIVAIKKLIVD